MAVRHLRIDPQLWMALEQRSGDLAEERAAEGVGNRDAWRSHGLGLHARDLGLRLTEDVDQLLTAGVEGQARVRQRLPSRRALEQRNAQRGL